MLQHSLRQWPFHLLHCCELVIFCEVPFCLFLFHCVMPIHTLSLNQTMKQMELLMQQWKRLGNQSMLANAHCFVGEKSQCGKNSRFESGRMDFHIFPTCIFPQHEPQIQILGDLSMGFGSILVTDGTLNFFSPLLPQPALVKRRTKQHTNLADLFLFFLFLFLFLFLLFFFFPMSTDKHETALTN